MVFKWRDEDVEKFLDLYREHECLWNVNHELYKNKAARETAYHKICINMNAAELTISDVKNKIKIIRTNYKSELNKVINSKINSPSDLYVPRVFWFKKVDQFLRGICEASSTANLIYQADLNWRLNDITMQSHEEGNLTSTIEHKYDPIINSTINIQKEPNFIHPAVTSSEQRSPGENNYRKTPTTKSKINEKKRSSNNMIAVENSINKILRIAEFCKETEDDEFDLFGKSIAVQLKRMPLERAFICQENIQTVIKQERLYQLNRSSSSCKNNNQSLKHYNATTTPADSFFPSML